VEEIVAEADVVDAEIEGEDIVTPHQLCDAAMAFGRIPADMTDLAELSAALLKLAEDLAGAFYGDLAELVADQDACELLLAKLTPTAE
jgi:hypothetical protein